MKPLLALCFAICALGALGCGGVKAADLFIVTRSGASPHTRLTLLVDEEGGVRCNGGPILKISDHALVIARATQEELQEDAAKHLSLPPQPHSVFSYYLRDENGTVSFADNSLHQSGVLHQLQLFVLETAQKACGLPQ